MDKLKIACFFPLSASKALKKRLYIKGMLKALQRMGYSISVFFNSSSDENPDDYHFADQLVPYDVKNDGLETVMNKASCADIVTKVSGKGILDELLEVAVLNMKAQGKIVALWDLDEIDGSSITGENFKQFDAVISASQSGGQSKKQNIIPIGNAADILTYHPITKSEEYASELTFIADADSVSPVFLKNYFLDIARKFIHKNFILVGKGWDSIQLPINVRYISEFSEKDLLKIYSSAQSVFIYNNEKNNFSFIQSILNCCCTGTSVITNSEEGLDNYLKYDEEYLCVNASEDLHDLIQDSSPEKFSNVAEKAIKRILTMHTFNHRALSIHKKIDSLKRGKIYI